MLATIIICTYNRSLVLSKTLQSYRSCIKAKENNIEFIIIDNNSNDDTSKVCEVLIQKGFEARYIFEPIPGLSYARNTGIKEAQGDIIIFVDDDVNFLCDIAKVYSDLFEAYPDAMAAGGMSTPVFEDGQPEWITEDLFGIYGSTNSGNSVTEMIYPACPFGLNMAFRKEVFEQIGSFNTALGRVKKNLLSNEESELFFRMHNAGMKLMYTPDAKLEHRIPAPRTTKQWILKRFYWDGVSTVIQNLMLNKTTRSELLNLGFQTCLKCLRIFLGSNFLSPKHIYWHLNQLNFSQYIALYRNLGYTKQYFSEALSMKRFNT